MLINALRVTEENEMAKLFEKNYKNNPYIYRMVNVLSSFCRNYAEANRVLEKNPCDTRSLMVKGYCNDFARWLSENTGFDFGEIGTMITKMIESENEE